MSEIPERKQWAWYELMAARDRDYLGYDDFDNNYDVLVTNPECESLLQVFTVTRKTSGILQDAPLWYPGRNIQAETLKFKAEADKRRAEIRAVLSLPKKSVSNEKL